MTAWKQLSAVLALLAVPAAAFAQTSPTAPPATRGPLQSVEAMTSTVFQSDQSSLSGIAVRVRLEPGGLIEGVSVMPVVEYWRNKNRLRAFDIESTRRDATLAALVRYDVTREGWQPYFGAGVGIHFLADEVDAPQAGLNDASDSLVKGGLALLGGVAFGHQGKLGNLLEVEYHHLPGQGQFKINWGLSWSFR